MKYTLLAFFALLISTSYAQQVKAPVDTTMISKHSISIKGKTVPYSAELGFQPVWDKNGNPVATLNYTYYSRSDVSDNQTRPLLISFNGGPGSASVWMHIAYTGPRILKITDEGYPVQPYGIKDNPNSVLDVADVVFVNPVNTGYSRMIADAEGKMPEREQFFGVNADISYLADWVNTFVTRHNRWRSPKFLIGESYGTTRVSGLANALQQKRWMYLNGVILVSPTEIGFEFEGPVEIANRLPYFAATAWYHDALPPALQNKDLTEMLPEVEAYTVNELLPVLAKGGYATAAEKESVAEKIAYYSGLSVETVKQNNLAVPFNYFWKDLLRNSKGFTVGRLDSRYRGIDIANAGTSPDYNSELTSWLHSFTPAINYYMREELGFKTDLTYDLFGDVHPWDRSNNHAGADLREAMAINPNLHLLVQSGYYDGACTYFNAKYIMGQININGKFDDRMDFKGYRSGHMMYLRAEDLKAANEDLRLFIEKASENIDQGAKY
ncbi:MULTISPECIES: carboxypeptidase [unclassified Leeuwenhoekiella]|uniref:S10 family peptidase n=1 Tax=unclassified Leeuwenhoekiella TaxID=2615029 RepID=UPI000C408436|nr:MULTISPECIES: carboxypeptidase [unclassified Leeuwenhoekiella]MAW94694.1 carboxypeptidase [Leeuwenhoekiella sp.]MAW95469.1 carboxypeptidase [Leeuwenhoekiella sp.]MBA82117.1 carboxypeptidase [Leeuwenhoekiella sp.]|tara:strand:- start:5010 stop:6497 length:1488 start_codon:yes stop_codon:yes gene_type:complete